VIRTRLRPPSVRETVVQLPNGFTLANLFFGIFAIVHASRGRFDLAVWGIVWGGIADALDGRVARAVGASGPFGEELDSLVDAITFGLAPAMIAYFSALQHNNWEWSFVWFFAACAVIRLARFNVTQAGGNKTHFVGLPSPAAGGTLATYFWFKETPLYRETIIGDWPWQFVLPGLMVLLACLMISSVPYPAWPRFSFRTWRGRVGILTLLAMIIGLILLPKQFIFPFAIAYILYGIVAAVVVGLTAETPDEDFLSSESPVGTIHEHRMTPPTVPRVSADVVAQQDPAARRRRKRKRGEPHRLGEQEPPPHPIQEPNE
jgi:CDP-diacylglycerol---serine O-phosphatidyltransferase